MSIVTEQHISAQVWTCTRCGGEDPKSCGCAAATATSREIQAKVERLAAKDEGSRQRQRAYRERKATLHNAPVENIDESPDKVLGLNAIGKPYGASYDPNYRVKTLLTNIKRLYAPMKPAPPSSPCETLLEKGWLQATPKAKRQFLRKYWDEILREKSAADDDCTEHTTEDASLVAVELAV